MDYDEIKEACLRKDGKVKGRIDDVYLEFLEPRYPRLTKTKSFVRAFLYNNDSEKCRICNDETFLETMVDDFICMACRKKRANDNRRKTSLIRYGVDSIAKVEEVKLKKKATTKERYGDECVLVAKRDEIGTTWLNKYGHSNPNKSELVKQKIASTNLERYGVACVFSSEKKRTSALETSFRNKTGHSTPDINALYDRYLEGELPEQISRDYGMSPSWIRRRFADANLPTVWNKNVSAAETLFRKSVEGLGVEVSANNRSILSGKEIDIWIPEFNLGIEYHGIYWHSDEKITDRHRAKSIAAEEAGVKLLQFWSSEVEDKNDIVMSIISSHLGLNEMVYARKCIIDIISNEEYRLFCEENHLQGSARASVKVALKHRDEIVCVMSFGKSRFCKKYEWEMIRFCNKKFTNVVGGASRLWKHFVRTMQPKSMVTYADARISEGNLYKKLGFEMKHHTGPNYFYTRDFHTLETRMKYQKHKLSSVLNDFDRNLTERQNMLNNKYKIVSDAGNKVFTYERIAHV